MIIEDHARAHEATYSSEQRKLSGTHYTPESVISYIVERTVEAALERGENFRDFRIIDPACGSGLFLLRAFDAACTFLENRDGKVNPRLARTVLENCIYGIDIDSSAIQAAQRNLLTKAKEYGVREAQISNHIIVGDALDLITNSASQLEFNLDRTTTQQVSMTADFSEVNAVNGFDCVIGNPPYVRIQNLFPMERRAKYASSFQTATGRFDISSLFIELGANLLKAGGQLGFIVSNKLLSINGARELRRFILNHFTIKEIIDLGDTRLFDAAILPMILILERGHASSGEMVFASATEIEGSDASDHSPRCTDLFQALRENKLPLSCEVGANQRLFQVQKFLTLRPSHTNTVWTFHSPSEKRILEKIRTVAGGTLEDVAIKISVGLKTTADEVFVKPMIYDFIRKTGLEHELTFPVLQSHNVDRWSIKWQRESDNFVLYPHAEADGKVLPVDLSRFPNAKKYLISHRKRLASRSYLRDAGRQWYEIWVHQSPSDFAKPKIVTPDISHVNRFALDLNGYFVNGTCFYLILKDQRLETYFLVLALLNSKVMEYFHKATSGNVLYAKRFRYWTTYLRQYPIPRDLDRNPSIVRQLAANARRLTELLPSQKMSVLENEIDRLVYRLFELDSSEIKEIEATLRRTRKGH